MTVKCIHCNFELFHNPVMYGSTIASYLFSCSCLKFSTIQDSFAGFQVMTDESGKRLVTRIMWDGTAMFSKFPNNAHIESFARQTKYAGRYIESTALIKVPFPFDIETISLDRIKLFVRNALLMS